MSVAWELPFNLPEINDFENGWGPSLVVPKHGIPFAPFSKSDPLGKEWNSNSKNRNMNRHGNFTVGTSSTFSYHHEDDEASFSLVDNRPKPKPRYKRRFHNRSRNNRWNPRGNWNNYRRGNRRNYGRRRWGNYPESKKDPSVLVSNSWEQVAEIDLKEIITSFKVASSKDVTTAGSLHYYNTKCNQFTPKNPARLQGFEKRQHFTATSSDDPILNRLGKEKIGNVYATDTILGVLMASPRSMNPWDLIVRKKNGIVFIDKRPDSKIDFLSVNENWNEVMEQDKESVNHPEKLSMEATFIDHNFSQQVLKEESINMKESSPFLSSLAKGNEPARVAYRYRHFDLGSVRLVARCTVNAVVKNKHTGENDYVIIRALNQFDAKISGGVDWKRKLETQTGAVLATEMKNNANKLTRWTAEMELSGAQEFRLGFVARTHSKDSFKHSILMCKRYKCATWAVTNKVRLSELWGTLKNILQVCLEQDDGTYVLMKDPNNAKLLLHRVPEGEPIEMVKMSE